MGGTHVRDEKKQTKPSTTLSNETEMKATDWKRSLAHTTRAKRRLSPLSVLLATVVSYSSQQRGQARSMVGTLGAATTAVGGGQTN